MNDIDLAVDAYIAELARRGRTDATRLKYRQVLDPFAAMVDDKLVDEITTQDCRRFLDQWTRTRPPAAGRPGTRPPASPSTLALYVSVLRGFFTFIHEDLEAVDENPMARIRRPARKRPEDLDVVTISSPEVRKMFDACQDWQELLCLAVIGYLGPRRSAAARALRSDADLENGSIRFREKGGKVIEKPIPDELVAIIRAADESHVWASGQEYLIPNRRSHRNAERSAKVVYDTVKRVADRAGVRAHVHALRAAFAVEFDEQQPGRLVALKELLGHARIETTMVYLRRKNKAREMETVRALTWGSVFPPNTGVPPAGFEPALPP